MRTLVVLLIGVVAFGSGIMLGFKLDSDESAVSAAAATGVPAAVEETRAALLEAAESGDYEALRDLIPSDASNTRSAGLWKAARSRTGSSSSERPTSGRSSRWPRS